MAGKQGDVLPETLRTWVDEQAAVSGEDTDELLSRAVTLYRLVEEHAASADADIPPGDGFDDQLTGFDDRLTEFDDRLRSVDRRVETVEADLDEKVTDLRERVIQVKREVDGKAPADHDHAELRERVDRAGASATRASERIDELEAHVDSGFENYEEIAEHLTDTTDDLDEKLTRLASVVVDLRRRTAEAERALATREAVDDLKTAAARHGETTANCDGCGSRVAIGLLTEPRCPHCDVRFAGVEPSPRFFGSATLTVDDTPALTAGERPTENGVDQGNQNTTTENDAGRDGPVVDTAELFTETRDE
ncbi:CopG family transcriptional regulator [Salinigranum marinum]|uniref:CopG family transcriptional regulator n=1 Tax=Salinigranum marinum TaxID=1515595 RepID=UPI002989E049|nr:CopG family transcriptional regulator [Salinigranum marinum]